MDRGEGRDGRNNKEYPIGESSKPGRNARMGKNALKGDPYESIK